jgi:S-DNA-T family DNA segregation ATPase FtsK/SpoIIIE
VEAALTRLMQRGREAGIHLVACTQKPAAAVIGGLVKSNFPVRIVGSVPSPEDAKVATGIAGTGAERLLGQGDLLVVAQGQVTRMQAAYVSVQQVRDLVGRLGMGAKPLLLAPTGTDGRHSGDASLAQRLAVFGSRPRLVK